METTLIATLGLVQTLLSQFGVTGGVVNQTLTALIQIVPLVTQLGPAAVSSVRNIISVLASSDDLTDEQLEALNILSAELDAAYDKALEAYLASKRKSTK